MIDYNLIQRIKEKTGIPEETIEKDYLIELLLNFLAATSFIKEQFVFRGGTALKKIYFPEFRYSEDIDFITEPGNNFVLLEKHIGEIVNTIKEKLPIECGIREILYPQPDQMQLFLSYDIVNEIRVIKELKMDIIEDSCILSAEGRKIIFTFDDFKDLDRSLITYDLESICAEKIMRILDVVCEPRDLWDLLYLLKSKVKVAIIKLSYLRKSGIDIDASNLIRALKNPNHGYSVLGRARTRPRIFLMSYWNK